MLDEPIALSTGYPEPVELRRLGTADADAFARHVAADEQHLGEHLPWPEVTNTPEGAADWLGRYERQEEGRVVVGGAWSGEELLGGALLLHYDATYANVELGVWAVTRAEGTGVASAACRELIRVARHDLKAQRIEWQAAVDNTRSRRLAEKLGFTYEGSLRSIYELRGQRHSIDILSLIGEEIDQAVARG
jgi:ribosomal-protein-serine acetyltransferase